jgi:RNA polymerase sigma-70 factor (ECF subfamily)
VAPPDAALVEAETREMVFRAIDSLRPRAREVVLLKVQEGKSYREIAEITGLSATNVGYILHHAMKALAGKLRGGEAEP